MLDYAAFPQQRQALIREILQQNGRVVCADLARQLAVSEHTIRRDLHELSKEGLCKKVYGGRYCSYRKRAALPAEKSTITQQKP